jgi:C-terminal processing protease CtpA/Prc
VKRKIKLLILPVTVLLSACQLFLGPEPDTSPPEVLKSLWNDFNNIHANLDFRMSNNLKYDDWYDVYHNKRTGYALKVSSDMSEESLFSVCAYMLRELNDPHVGLYAPGKYSSSYNTGRDDFNISDVRNKLIGRGNDIYKNFVFGVFSSDPDIGYINISSFINEDAEKELKGWGRAIDSIVKSLANTKALVLDVRSNRGGDIYIMEYIAAYFTSEKKDYIKARIKTGSGANDLSAPIVYTVKSIKKSSGNKYGYTKPIVLLTNGNTVSAAEWFTLALRTQTHVTHMGMKTCGAFSARNDRFMINGWIYSISPERVTDINDIYYEGIGIIPEIEIKGTSNEQLEEAINLLGGKGNNNEPTPGSINFFNDAIKLAAEENNENQ